MTQRSLSCGKKTVYTTKAIESFKMARLKSFPCCVVVFIAACSFSEAQLTSTRQSAVPGSNEIPKEQSNQGVRLTPDHEGVNQPAQTSQQESDVDDLKLDLIIKLLGKLQGQVTELRSKVDKFKSIEKIVQNKPVVLKILPKQECKQKGEFLYFQQYLKRISYGL